MQAEGYVEGNKEKKKERERRKKGKEAGRKRFRGEMHAPDPLLMMPDGRKGNLRATPARSNVHADPPSEH